MKSLEHNYHTLLIEDNPGDVFLLKDFLEEKIVNPRIDNAHNSEKAKPYLKDNTYDIILFDISLSHTNCKNVIKEIIELAEDTPVIVLTSYTSLEFSLESLNYGISDYLVKDELNATTLFKSIVYNIERKKTFLQLEASEKRYSDLFHFSPEPKWVYDQKTLRFLDVNKAAIIKYGYSHAQFLNLKISDLQLSFNGKLTSMLQNIKDKDKLFLKNLSQHELKSGKRITVDIKSTEVDYKGRKAILSNITDISERLKYFQALKKQNKQLSEIAWMQSHMVRAPLTKILGITDLINADDISKHEFNYMLKNLKTSAEELDEVIKGISKKSKIISINKLNDEV